MRQETREMARASFARVAWLPLLVVLLTVGAAASPAVDFYFTGQVFQVTQEDADDPAIADAGLIGDGRPYAKVLLYDSDTNALLGETIADHEGVFTVTYDQPALGSTPNVRLRVFQEEADPAVDVELAEAREGLNHFAAVGRFFGSGLRVITDDYLAYGADGLTTYPGVGIVFTRVGKVEIPFIEQDLTEPLVGLADFTSDPSRASELHVRAFEDAPFARGLLIFGEFGLPGGACTGDQISHYRVMISKFNEVTSTWGADVVWTQDMTKMKTTVSTSPTVTVTHDRVPVGPFTGTDSVTLASIPGLYWVNRNTLGDPSVFYSFPDQRVNWQTNGWPDGDGLYRITMEYYKFIGGSIDAPSVSKLDDSPGGCFAGTPPTGADGLHRLYLTVNNDPMTVRFDHIYLRNGAGNYFPKTGTTPTPNVADALDFANEGLCEIMEAGSTYNIEVQYTAHHTGDFMRYYTVSATPNAGSTVTFASESYPPSTPFTAPAWAGTPATGATATALNGEFVRCGYDFQISAGSRLQNGYQHVQWAHPDLAFYVNKPIP